MSVPTAPDLPPSSVNPQWRVAIVRSLWHPDCTAALRDSAVNTLVAHGMALENITAVDVPGAFEIPLLAKELFARGTIDGIIAFGVVLQGDTFHAELVANQTASGIMEVQLAARKPIVFEVLYVDSIDDARSRSLGPGSKGPSAARTLLSCLAQMEKLR